MRTLRRSQLIGTRTLHKTITHTGTAVNAWLGQGSGGAKADGCVGVVTGMSALLESLAAQAHDNTHTKRTYKVSGSEHEGWLWVAACVDVTCGLLRC
jgi:hypothetical protein